MNRKWYCLYLIPTLKGDKWDSSSTSIRILRDDPNELGWVQIRPGVIILETPQHNELAVRVYTRTKEEAEVMARWIHKAEIRWGVTR